MRQSAFTVLTPVHAERVGDLERLLNDIGDDIDENPHIRFADLENLHYASFVVVAEDGREPYLVFEGNVDGGPQAFLETLLETAGEAVDTIYGHCVDYPPAGTRDRAAVLDYLAAHDVGADTFYVAWPGATVGEIRREQQLRDHIEDFLDQQGQADLRRQTPESIRRRIADHVAADPTLGWARSTPPLPFLVRKGQLVLYLVAAPAVLGVVGVVEAALGRSSKRRNTNRARVILASLAAAGAGAACTLRRKEAGDDRKDRQRDPGWQGIYARWTESRDLAGIVRREDVQVQNHMTSVTRIKDGWFRLTVLRVVLWVVNLIARLTANKGRLGGISSIHFARWVITPDRKRLIFLSNFDGSWESYLNDFIDLAAQGLTAVWTNTDNDVGFPTTRWLVTKGARDEARFKAYARFSMVPTNTWYSAYPELTVANIENNRRIRRDLFSSLDEPAVEAWLRRL